jgi:hypothetical protein
MKLLFMYFSPSFCYFLSLGSEHSPQHPFLGDPSIFVHPIGLGGGGWLLLQSFGASDGIVVLCIFVLGSLDRERDYRCVRFSALYFFVNMNLIST